jgi:hypothetical protein
MKSANERNSLIDTLRVRLAVGVIGVLIASHALQGQDRARYRDYQLEDNLAKISASTGVPASEAKTIHQRPAIMQELQWRLPYFGSGSTPAHNDPVKQIVFSFYNDQLSKMVVDYEPDRTAGMTDADVIDAISVQYGPQLKRGAKASPVIVSKDEQDSGAPVAQWGDADYSVVLFRSSYRSGLRIIVASPRLEALARTANAEALRLDVLDAPRLELAQHKKETEDARASEEKARLVNKAVFRP